jgi:hypothetical protein
MVEVPAASASRFPRRQLFVIFDGDLQQSNRLPKFPMTSHHGGHRAAGV